jgi:hypothetical protein
MNIDRVLFSLNNNKIYSSFWNINSEIYYKFYNVTPTLIYYGSKDEALALGLSEKFGEIFFIDNKNNFVINKDRDCFVPFTMFFYCKNFEKEVCMTSGIDQIPLSGIFFDKIKQYEEDLYIVPFSDAYGRVDLFPSSHHVGKGSTFNDIYNFSDSFADEIDKMYKMKNCDPSLPRDLWGLDETYSSRVISSSIEKGNKNIVLEKNYFYKDYSPRKLDRSTILHNSFSLDKLKSSFYTEFHSLRPFEQYKNIITEIVNERYGSLECLQ